MRAAYVSSRKSAIHSKSAQNLEYSPFCDSSSRTTRTLFPTALFADTTPNNAGRRRHSEGKSHIVKVKDDRLAARMLTAAGSLEFAAHALSKAFPSVCYSAEETWSRTAPSPGS